MRQRYKILVGVAFWGLALALACVLGSFGQSSKRNSWLFPVRDPLGQVVTNATASADVFWKLSLLPPRLRMREKVELKVKEGNVAVPQYLTNAMYVRIRLSAPNYYETTCEIPAVGKAFNLVPMKIPDVIRTEKVKE
jgi:hypothetical protein